MTFSLSIARRRLTGLGRDEAGSILVYVAFATPILIGLTGLSIDVATWRAHHQLLQSAADSAAIAGALEIQRSQADSQLVIDAATLDATTNGYGATADDVIIINYPPTLGASAGSTSAVEVALSRPVATAFAQIFLAGPVMVSARAVAATDPIDACVWALNGTAMGALTVAGGVQANLDCGVMVNSSDASALRELGGACLTATSINIVGDYSGTCIDPTPSTGLNEQNDPLATLAAPSYGGCDTTGKTTINGGATATLEPGVYCGDIAINGGATVTFNPGLYVLEDSDLSINGGTSVSGTDVTFYFSGNGEVDIDGGANVTMSAPTSGDQAGLLFYNDRNASPTITHKFTGGAQMQLAGILYFPATDVDFTGGSSTAGSVIMLVADEIRFTGGTELGAFAGSPVEASPFLTAARLVE